MDCCRIPQQFPNFPYIDTTHTALLKAFQKEVLIVTGAQYKQFQIVGYYDHCTPKQNENLIMYSNMAQSGCKVFFVNTLFNGLFR